MRKKTLLSLTLVLALALVGCSDPTSSDEYLELETDLSASVAEVADLEQQLAETKSELNEAETALAEASSLVEAVQVPAEILALLDDWYEANNRKDGSVVDLYKTTGYHHDGTKRVPLNEVADEFQLPAGWEANWTTEPYLIVDDGDGRYVVTRGLRLGTEAVSYTSAFTFEIEMTDEGKAEIVHSAWTYAH